MTTEINDNDLIDSIKEPFQQACNLLAMREFKQAVDILYHLGESQPLNLNVQLKLIEAYINLSRYAEAYRVLSRISIEFPEDRAVLLVTPIVLFCMNQYDKAYKATLKLTEKERNDKQIQNVIRHSIIFTKFDSYSEVSEKDVLKLIDSQSISEREFYSLAQLLLSFKLGLSNKSVNLELDQLAHDALFIKFLSFSYIRSPVFEQLVTTIRSKLLAISLAKMELPDNLVPLAQALSYQSFHNEYVFFVSEDEQKMVSELEVMLVQVVEAEEWSPHDVEGLFLLLCMYRLLHSLSFNEALLNLELSDWPESLRSLVELTLYGIEDELKWVDRVESIGDIRDQVSTKVREQYEESPYPRWSQLYFPHQKCSYQEYMSRNIYGYQCNTADQRDYDVLIAGCGTGFHPLSMAGSVNANITAIDLSKRSLAYASKSAKKQGVSNVSFYQADLLNVDDLGCQYDVVESVGVIHHMRDPEEGLIALLSALKPKGYLRLGLYSAIAREKLIKLRQLYVESGMQPNEDNIRAIRQTMLNSKSAQDVFGVVNDFADFYTMSACRDLIFHEEEHCFTIPEIKTLLERHQLTFLGFSGLKKTVLGEFVQKNGVENLDNLDAWDEFEAEHPSTFNCMYQFMTQKIN